MTAGCGGLAQAREGIDGDRAFDLVTVLGVRVDNIPHILVQFSQLRCLERAKIGVPDAELMTPVGPGRFAQGLDLASGELLGLGPGRRLGE